MECNESLGKLWKDDASSFAHTWGQIPILGQLVKLYDLRGSGQSCALESTWLLHWEGLLAAVAGRRQKKAAVPISRCLKAPVQLSFSLGCILIA